MNFLKYKKIFLVCLIIILLGVFLQKYPFGVRQYKTISLGMQAVESAGTKTIWAPPDDVVPK